MPENTKPTVDLRENMQPKTRSAQVLRTAAIARPAARPIAKPILSETKKLPKEFELDDKQEFQRITRPTSRQNVLNDRLKNVLWLIAIIVIILGGYFFWYRPKYTNKPIVQEKKWSMVKLVDGEFFYGQVVNESADPMVIENVYYDYDKLSASNSTKDKEGNPVAQPEVPSNPSGQIRLVRRGKEPHGPTGSLSVVRAQVLYMEELKPDSKILKTIIADLAKTGQ